MGLEFQAQRGAELKPGYNFYVNSEKEVKCVKQEEESINLNTLNEDKFDVESSENKSAKELREEIHQTKNEQGFIGKIWDGFKNASGIGAGSIKANKAISDYKKGKISLEEMNKAVKDYKDGQKECVDTAADIISGIASFGTFAALTGIGIAAAPFTGGASLTLVAAGFGAAGITGAGVKAGIKKLDCVVGGREYNSFGYDIATGGINGMLAPVTAGIGGAVGKAVASRVGVNAIRQGSEIVLSGSISSNTANSIAKTILTTNMKYEGGTTAARAISLGSDMAANGAAAGSIDAGVKYIAGESENKSLKGLSSEVKKGLISGLVGAPVIGGGMKAAGKYIGRFTNNLEDKVSNSYNNAKSSINNNPEVKSTDMEVLSEISDILSQSKDIVENKSNIGNADEIAKKSIGIAGKITDTEAYKQLGDLPERLTSVLGIPANEANVTVNKVINSLDEIHSGKIAKGIENLSNISEELNNTAIGVGNGTTSIYKGIKNGGLDESAEVLGKRLGKLVSSPDFQKMTREEQLQAIMENSNILFSKFAQTYSTNKSLPPEVSQIFKQFTSHCTVSRKLPEAQKLADELYGTGKYTIKKSFGAGTIGETYLAENAEGKEVVIKMLKEGVTPERFKEDRAMFVKYINEFEKDATAKEYKLNLINGMFDAWEKELNFGIEAQGAKRMAEGSQRFSVAQTIEVGSKNGQNISLVMEKADGVRLDNLLEMIKLYKENPNEYYTKYRDEIKANPALKTPENWMKDLGETYKKAQNEQVMFIGKSGTRTIHADPHPGNIFVDFEAKTGKPKIIYIDTGNVIERTNSQTLQDISLSINMMVGNSRGIAEAMISGAKLPSGSNKKDITDKFTKLLDERLFKSGVNLNNAKYSQNIINQIMKELNIVPDASNSNLIKATIQRLETSKAINEACGTYSGRTIDKKDFKDLLNGFYKSFKANPIETLKTIKPILKWIYGNTDQAMTTFFQMVIKRQDIK